MLRKRGETRTEKENEAHMRGRKAQKARKKERRMEEVTLETLLQAANHCFVSKLTLISLFSHSVQEI